MIESIDYFVEDIDKFYNHHLQKEEDSNVKAGFVLSMSAFFAGIEK